MNLPRISIVMPSFNQAEYLEAAIRSLRAQEYPALEVIVMDGGSSDGSVEILRRYATDFAYWTSASDAGQADALNRGFAQATGDVFGWLNSDDMLLPNALTSVGAYFAEHAECDFLTGDGVFVNADATREEYQVRASAYTLDELLHYSDDKYLPQPAVFFTRAAWERVGGVDARLTYAMDLDLWLRMRQFYPLHHIPMRLAQMRLHPAAKGARAGRLALKVVEQLVRRYWARVSFGQRVKLYMGLRRMTARGECRSGLESVLQGDTGAGWRALAVALLNYPPVVFQPVARQLLARLILPLPLRRR